MYHRFLFASGWLSESISLNLNIDAVFILIGGTVHRLQIHNIHAKGIREKQASVLHIFSVIVIPLIEYLLYILLDKQLNIQYLLLFTL